MIESASPIYFTARPARYWATRQPMNDFVPLLRHIYNFSAIQCAGIVRLASGGRIKQRTV
jgi:hypothetical protein